MTPNTVKMELVGPDGKVYDALEVPIEDLAKVKGLPEAAFAEALQNLMAKWSAKDDTDTG